MMWKAGSFNADTLGYATWGMSQNAAKEEYPQFLCMRKMARGISNSLFLNVPWCPKKVQNPVTFFKCYLLWQVLKSTAHKRRGSPYRLKAFFEQERLTLQSYNSHSWIECTSAGFLTHTWTKERGCSALHHSLDFQDQQPFRSYICPKLTPQSIHSNTNNYDLHPSAIWIGFLIETLATCMTDMVGWTSCVI